MTNNEMAPHLRVLAGWLERGEVGRIDVIAEAYEGRLDCEQAIALGELLLKIGYLVKCKNERVRVALSKTAATGFWTCNELDPTSCTFTTLDVYPK